MVDFAVSRLEDLPYEMLIEIFQYLFADELYSFSNLNIRLNSIIKSLFKLMLITTFHHDPALSFFHPLSTIQIDFHHSTSSLLFQYNFSHFVGIRSFILPPMTCLNNYIEPIKQIDTLLFLFPNLRVFHLTADQYKTCMERLDIEKLAQCLRHYLPHLNKLELRIGVMHRNRPSLDKYTLEEMTQMHPLFRFFNRRDGLLHIASFDLTSKYHCYLPMISTS